MGAVIRADLDGSVHMTNRLGQRVVLVAGQPVPDGFTAGDHLLEGKPAPAPVEAPAPPPPRATAAVTHSGGDSGSGEPAAPPVKKAAAKRPAVKKAPAKKAAAKKAPAKRAAKKTASKGSAGGS